MLGIKLELIDVFGKSSLLERREETGHRYRLQGRFVDENEVVDVCVTLEGQHWTMGGFFPTHKPKLTNFAI